MKRNIEILASLVKKNSFENSRERSEREKQNEKWTKEAREEEKPNLDFLGLGSFATILFLAVLGMLLILNV